MQDMLVGATSTRGQLVQDMLVGATSTRGQLVQGMLVGASTRGQLVQACWLVQQVLEAS